MEQFPAGDQSTPEQRPFLSSSPDEKWSGFAIAGFIISLAFFIPFIHIIAIVFSIIALGQTGPGRKRGRVLAIVGLVIASLNLIIGAVLGAIGAL